MNNQITFNGQYESLTEEMIADAIPMVEGADIYVNGISYRKTGHGHWKLDLQLSINDEWANFYMTTTDSMSIDNWNNDDADEGDLGEDIQASFIVRVLSENETAILEFISELEEEEEE